MLDAQEYESEQFEVNQRRGGWGGRGGFGGRGGWGRGGGWSDIKRGIARTASE